MIWVPGHWPISISGSIREGACTVMASFSLSGRELKLVEFRLSLWGQLAALRVPGR